MNDSKTLSPITLALDALDELHLFTSVANVGLDWSKGLVEIGKLLGKSDLEKEQSRREKIQAFANNQASRGFPYLWESAAVRMWSILETCVGDLMLLKLGASPDLSSYEPLKGLKGPIIEFALLDKQDQTRYLRDLVLTSVRLKAPRGVDRFEAVLRAISLDGAVNADVKRELFKLSECRNAIVHNNGRVDYRLRSTYPDALKVGDPVPVSSRQHHAWIAASYWYLVDLDIRLHKDEDLAMHRKTQLHFEDSLVKWRAAQSSQIPEEPGERGAQAT